DVVLAILRPALRVAVLSLLPDRLPEQVHEAVGQNAKAVILVIECGADLWLGVHDGTEIFSAQDAFMGKRREEAVLPLLDLLVSRHRPVPDFGAWQLLVSDLRALGL